MDKPEVPTEPYDENALAEWAKTVEAEIAEISSSLLPLQQKLEAAHEKLDLIQRLMHLSRGTNLHEQKIKDAYKPVLKYPSTPDIEDHIQSVLANAKHPLHISAIRNALVEMGVPLPGRGDEANLILRIRRATSRFIRTGRGFYGLVEWNLPPYTPHTRKRKVRRRKVSAT